MLARIDAIKLVVVHGDIVYVTRTWHELDYLGDLACSGVVFDKTWSVTLMARRAFLLMPGHLPYKAVIPGNPVQPFGKPRKARGGEHIINLPGLGVDADKRVKTIRIYPDF